LKTSQILPHFYDIFSRFSLKSSTTAVEPKRECATRSRARDASEAATAFVRRF